MKSQVEESVLEREPLCSTTFRQDIACKKVVLHSFERDEKESNEV